MYQCMSLILWADSTNGLKRALASDH